MVSSSQPTVSYNLDLDFVWIISDILSVAMRRSSTLPGQIADRPRNDADRAVPVTEKNHTATSHKTKFMILAQMLEETLCTIESQTVDHLHAHHGHGVGGGAENFAIHLTMLTINGTPNTINLPAPFVQRLIPSSRGSVMAPR